MAYWHTTSVFDRSMDFIAETSKRIGDGSGFHERFWLVHGLYWSIAGIALFISGLTHAPISVALVRNLFFGIGGYVLGIALVQAFRRFRLRFESAGSYLLACLSLAFISSTAMVVLINPLSMAQLGIEFADLNWRHFFGGTMNYALVMVLWSLLYLFMFDLGPLPVGGPRGGQFIPSCATSIEVGDGRVSHQVSIDQVIALRASGDYVEVVTADKVFLKRSTLNAMEQALKHAPMLRVHRSLLINQNHLMRIEGENKGRFELLMSDGQRLHSSRSYRDRIVEAWSDKY